MDLLLQDEEMLTSNYFDPYWAAYRTPVKEIAKRKDQLPWDWKGLADNPTITLEDILSHPELPWDLNRVVRYSPHPWLDD